MINPPLMAMLPMLVPQATPVPPAVSALREPVSIDGAWVGPEDLICLKERSGGRLIGCLPGSPGTTITEGELSGSIVTLTFEGEDGGGPIPTGEFTGVWTGTVMRGLYAEGSGSIAVTLTRPLHPLEVEHWLLVDSGGRLSPEAEASRITQAGAFFGGGFRGILQCAWPACGGVIDSWAISGSSHFIETSSDGSCASSTSMVGSLDSSTHILSGSYTSTDCLGTSSGVIQGGKRGLTNDADIQEVLSLVADLCDALEAESPSAVDAFHSSYIHDGYTPTSWMTLFTEWYGDYESIEATPVLTRIITFNDGEVPAILAAPDRLDWSLLITGIPNGGGARETIHEYQTGPFEDQWHFLGMEGTRRVFVGNDELLPFSLDMPISAGDEDLSSYVIWPYGVHGGGHPEGHLGMDISFAAGTNTLAATDGTVTYIGSNSYFSDRYDLILEARPGVNVHYDHMGTPIVAEGDRVLMGEALGSSSHAIHVHFAISASGYNACPPNFFNSSGQSTFDSLWASAAYREELVEPLRCNPHPVTFPLTVSRTLVSGSLSAARMEFTRLAANSDVMTYTLFDAGGNAFESGDITWLLASYPLSKLEMTPSDLVPVRYCTMDIVGPDLWIDWDTINYPVDLTSASHYVLD